MIIETMYKNKSTSGPILYSLNVSIINDLFYNDAPRAPENPTGRRLCIFICFNAKAQGLFHLNIKPLRKGVGQRRIYAFRNG